MLYICRYIGFYKRFRRIHTWISRNRVLYFNLWMNRLPKSVEEKRKQKEEKSSGDYRCFVLASRCKNNATGQKKKWRLPSLAAEKGIAKVSRPKRNLKKKIER